MFSTFSASAARAAGVPTSVVIDKARLAAAASRRGRRIDIGRNTPGQGATNPVLHHGARMCGDTRGSPWIYHRRPPDENPSREERLASMSPHRTPPCNAPRRRAADKALPVALAAAVAFTLASTLAGMPGPAAAQAVA